LRKKKVKNKEENMDVLTYALRLGMRLGKQISADCVASLANVIYKQMGKYRSRLFLPLDSLTDFFFSPYQEVMALDLEAFAR
jgi:hypothetical protein